MPLEPPTFGLSIRRRLGCIAILFVATLTGCAGTGDPTAQPAPDARRAADLSRRHMVAAANPLAAQAGLEMLRAGGSAVDAAIAAQAVLTLVEPQSSGIGGGAFLLHFRKSDARIDAYDGRETAPAALRPRIFEAPDGTRRAFRDAASGGQAVGVPGVLRMLALAHRAHGKLPWARLFDPAIRLSEDGFAVSPRLHRMIDAAPGLAAFPAARAYFLTDAGAALPVGSLLRNPALGDTYRRIAAEGEAAFYRGDVAADIVSAVRDAARNPGTLTAEDLAGYTAKQRPVLCRPYRVWRVCGMPPPTSGGVAVLQILGLLERFDLARHAPGSPQAIHLFAEAARLAYADRNRYLGDPDFVAVPVDGLLDPAYLARRAALISPSAAMEAVAPGLPPGARHAAQEDGHSAAYDSTSHLSAVDGDGNAVSMTTSVERPFGSYLMVRGFLLNNQLTDFAFLRGPASRPVANAPAPGKRPRSSMSPVLVFDMSGNLMAAVGSPGGPRIIMYVAKTLIGLLDWRLGMQAAIDLPNIALRGRTVEIERASAAAGAGEALRALGHRVEIRALTSGLHGIRLTEAGFDGGADRRREGVAIGD